MKSDKWIIEIEGKKYAVDRCFSGEPAIYHAGGEFQSRGHVDDPFEKSVTGYWGVRVYFSAEGEAMTLSILEDIWKEAPDGFKAGVSFDQWLADLVFILRNAIEKTLEENRHLADGEKCTLWRLKQAIGM